MKTKPIESKKELLVVLVLLIGLGSSILIERNLLTVSFFLLSMVFSFILIADGLKRFKNTEKAGEKIDTLFSALGNFIVVGPQVILIYGAFALVVWGVYELFVKFINWF